MKCHWCDTALDPEDMVTQGGGGKSLGPTYPTKDHVHPKSKGGTDVVSCCFACNQLKGDMTAKQWRAFLSGLREAKTNPGQILGLEGSRGARLYEEYVDKSGRACADCAYWTPYRRTQVMTALIRVGICDLNNKQTEQGDSCPAWLED